VATTRDIRRRIKSVANTQQLTKAMKMVSAAKLRRAQEAMFRSRPYAEALLRVLRSLASRVSSEEHPLLADRGDERVELVVMTADKGLCGSFNTNIIRRAVEFLAERKGSKVTLHH
jgi:F-type H+-transporting ATPase subunit gamma